MFVLFGVIVFCCGVDSQQYVIYQNVKVFNWLCPKCTSDQLPFHDCSVLSRGTSDVYSNSSTLIIEFDFPLLSSTAGLRVAHLNCRSLLSITEVSDLIVRNSIDVFAVTENWLDSSIEDSETFNFSYSFPINIVRNDCNHHGGVWPFWSPLGSSLWLDLICVKVMLSQFG